MTDWLADRAPGAGRAGLTHGHIRGWLVTSGHVRTIRSSATARGWFAGVRHFTR